MAFKYIQDVIAAQESCANTTKGKATQSEHANQKADPEAVESATEAPRGNATPKNVSSSSTYVKVLRIRWNEISHDEICYDLSELVEYAKSLPQRSVLKLSAKIFDPIGLFTPFNLRSP